ncbi:conjugal transfer protein TrbJ [Sphingosinicella microcystinivorans]|uniref:conjugal transfer protein TrbJ n=1 Tax=Sphingosinicella microcystinivorans TaxID=335406 RepID=UPI0022F3CEC1|nr:P-type conjugative transfer protein TrbJ [Sphingosinicella microcystinivorans]WBX82858.1 P-type conjugative transfer protein TrbJ [Sphingosinicella microcystinivorans]
MKTFIVAGLLGIGAVGSAALVVPAAQAMPVFDSNNYAQNLLIAARTLSQINNQIRSLQNEAEVLVNMAKNLSRIDFPQLSELQRKLRQIDLLMNQARLIDFRLDELDAKFRALFPEEYDRALSTDRRVIEARRRLDAGMEGFRHAMEVQAQVVGNVRDDAEALSAIVACQTAFKRDPRSASKRDPLFG